MWYSLWPPSLETEVKGGLGEQVLTERCEQQGDSWDHVEAADETQLD